MSKTKVINGESFEISQPYAEGHVMTAAEAKALNQTRSENIGNNLRSAVADAIKKRDEGDPTDFQGLAALVAKYDSEYTFALGGSGPSTRKLDPVEREARSIANDIIKADLAAKGRKLSQVPDGLTKEEWEAKVEAIREELMQRDNVLKLARDNVKKRKAVIDAGLEGLAA